MKQLKLNYSSKVAVSVQLTLLLTPPDCASRCALPEARNKHDAQQVGCAPHHLRGAAADTRRLVPLLLQQRCDQPLGTAHPDARSSASALIGTSALATAPSIADSAAERNARLLNTTGAPPHARDPPPAPDEPTLLRSTRAPENTVPPAATSLLMFYPLHPRLASWLLRCRQRCN